MQRGQLITAVWSQAPQLPARYLINTFEGRRTRSLVGPQLRLSRRVGKRTCINKMPAEM